jgi:hypothetical protein
MIRHLHSQGLFRPSGWALLIIGSLPLGASAESISFRNECPAPIVVQAVAIGPGGIVRRDRPYLLNRGEATPAIILPGEKIVTIYDARVPNRVVFQGAIPNGRADLYFAVVPDVAPGRVRIELRRPPSRSVR